MQWTIERSRRTGEGRKRIGVCAADTTHRVCAAILFMISVQDIENRQSPFENRVGLVLQLCRLEHHVEEIALIAQIVIGICVLHSDPVSKSESSNRRDLCDQAINLFPTTILIEDIFGVWIKR